MRKRLELVWNSLNGHFLPAVSAVLFFLTSAGAEQPINLVRVVDKDAMSYSEVVNTLSLVNTFLQRELRITLLPAGEYEYLDESKTGLSLGNFEVAFNHWLGQAAADNLLIKKSRLTLVILPPIYDDWKRYSGGMARVGSVGVGPALAVVACTRSLEYCSKAIAHEVLHTLGARHVPQGIMSPGAGSWEIAPRTRKQVSRHLRAVKLWRSIKH